MYCKQTAEGTEYVGTISQTRTGRVCQRWDKQAPHSHTRTDPDMFPEDTVEKASNFCRNPDGEPGGPWCYTTDSTTRWEYCDIPKCNSKPMLAKVAETKSTNFREVRGAQQVS